MTAQTVNKNSAKNSSGDDAHRSVRPDSECRARASQFLTELIGSPPDDLLWDDTHHLQGHGHLRGRELVVIAPRDDDHKTIVLTAEDWDAVRRASSDQRRELLVSCAIADHKRLVAVFHLRKSSRRLTVAA